MGMKKCRCYDCTGNDRKYVYPDVNDWEDPRWVKNRGKKKKRKREGCPGNEGKAHIYVWNTETYDYLNFYGKCSSYTVTRYTCCGCGKINRRKGYTYKEI